MTLIDTIITLYEMTASDIAALESELFDQLRLSYLEQLRTLAIQHGAVTPTPVLQGAELEALHAKARTDAEGIAATYNRDLRRQVEAIAERNPQADRGLFIRILASWGRERDAGKSITIAIQTILWAAQYGLERFIDRNNLQNQLFRALHGSPVCQICMRIVAAGVVNFRYVQANPLPAHLKCMGEWTVVTATDLNALGYAIWAGQ